MNNEIEIEIEIDDEIYVKKSSINLQTSHRSIDGLDYVIARTYSAGVFAGYLKLKTGKEVTLINARRLWKFYSASLSQLAQSGTPKPEECKFPEEVDNVILTEVIEILSVTEEAKKTIDRVEIWKV